jgi:surface protein
MGLGRRFFLSTIKKETAMPFISEWRTTNTSSGSSNSDQVKLPLISTGTYNFVVNWGDGNSDTITAWNQAETTHTYASSGDYTITITGVCIGWAFANTGDRLKISTISQWGDIRFLSVAISSVSQGAFTGCANLQITATDTPINLPVLLNYFFRGCTALTGNSSFNNWNLTGVTQIGFFFYQCTNFNANIGAWNVSSVTRMDGIFYQCVQFNNGGSSSINNWNTSNVTAFGITTNAAFRGCTNFNQPIGNWNISNVNTLRDFFRDCVNFNQPLNDWNVSNVTNLQETFRGCINFNQNIGAWNVSQVTTMQGAFLGCSNYNNGGSDSIKDWVTSNVLTFGGAGTGVFQNCSVFNQPIGHWNTINATAMRDMFNGAIAFNQNIGSWDVSKVNNFVGFMAGKTPSTFSSSNLDAIYNGWSALTFINTGLTISFGTAKYTAAGQAGRDILTDPPNNWAITDGGI